MREREREREREMGVVYIHKDGTSQFPVSGDNGDLGFIVHPSLFEKGHGVAGKLLCLVLVYDPLWVRRSSTNFGGP